MDNVVKVRRSFLNEICAILRAFRSPCGSCYRKYCDCAFSNEMARAKMMIAAIDTVRDAEEERFYIENPADEFMEKILKAIRQGGGKPVSSNCIVIEGESRQRKARALKVLVKRNKIRKLEIDGKPFYVLACETNKKKHK